VTGEVLDRVIQLVVAAFGLVAALAWNDAIQTLFTAVLGEAGSLAAKFLYAVLITGVVVFVTVRLSRMSDRIKREEAQRREETS
jgi:hypothetical protein